MIGKEEEEDWRKRRSRNENIKKDKETMENVGTNY